MNFLKHIVRMVFVCILVVCMVPEKPVYAIGGGTPVQIGSEEVVEVTVDLELLQTGGLLTGNAEEEPLLTAAQEQGTYEEIELALLTSFDLLQESCDVSEFHIQKADISRILKRVLNSNPRYFYVDIKSYFVGFTSQEVKTINITYLPVADNDYEAVLTRYDEAVEQAVRGADPDWSQLEKALYINDYLCRNCKFDLKGENENRYNAYGAFIDKTATCQGYSLAFLELSKWLGVDCTIVTSTSVNHAWNMVCINGEYYYVDATWNDPNPDRLGRAKHVFFLKSYDYFAAQNKEYTTHFKEQDWVIANGLTYDVADNPYYDDYFMNSYNVGFSYVDGNWYGYNKKAADQKGVIERFVCDGKDFTYQEDTVTIDNFWCSPENPDDTYFGQACLDSYQQDLYYSDRNTIYCYHADTKDTSIVYTLSEKEQLKGSIYGIFLDEDGRLFYLLSKTPDTIEKGFVLTPEKSEITYHLGDGTNSEENPLWYCSMDEVVFAPPVKAGYIFEGWYLDEAYETAITKIEKGSSGDLELYAKWSPETYTIHYVLNGGKNDRANPTAYTCETEDIILKKPSRTGYTFAGWYPDEEYVSSQRVVGIQKGSTGDITLYAKWIENKYTILFNGNGATSGAVQALTCEYGQSYYLNPNTYKKKGYTFKGWAWSLADAEKGFVYYEDKAPITNLSSQNGQSFTFYAVWSRDDYKISYVLNGGKKNQNPAGYSITSPTIQLKKPVKTGYTFGGWYLNAACSKGKKVTKIATGTTGNITLYAKWTANKYTIKFKGNGATSGSLKSKTYTYGKSYRLPANKFKKKGYTFKGWAISAKKAKKGIVAYKNKANIRNLTSKNKGTKTLYAVWKKKK